MTRQKKDNSAVPESRRKSVPSRANGGGKAITTDKQAVQLDLFSGIAEGAKSAKVGKADEKVVKKLSRTASFAKPQPEDKRKSEPQATTVTIEKICERLDEALTKVHANKGAPGPDRQSVKEVRENWSKIKGHLAEDILRGDYKPGDIRRVWIPKSGGGKRGLGIPNVVDRVVQEAIRLELEPVYNGGFSPYSHGFRPEMSCHTAIAQAVRYMEDGYDWVVDIDLKDFFNRVNHQRLTARLSRDITDKRVLWLISRMLKAQVVMPDGVKVMNDEGVPQGGPLSPLLSNIVLDELDKELTRRGHKFVRYADDCNIYVRSAQAGHRVMASVKSFLERKLRLEVNTAKSAVAKPEERHFLGFRLRRDPLYGDVEILLSKRSVERISAKTKDLTPRNYGGSIGTNIKEINRYLQGWMGFFRICSEPVLRKFRTIDAHIRRRLRAIQLKHWKRKRTIVRELIKRGANRNKAWQAIYQQRKSLWALSHIPIVEWTLNNAYWAKLGLVSLANLWTGWASRS